MRIGKRNDPHYRIVVMPARTKRDGKAVEHIGNYDPRSKKINLNEERVKYWLSVGAKPTDTIKSILTKKNLIEKEKRFEKPALKPKKERKEEGKETTPAASLKKEGSDQEEVKKKSEPEAKGNIKTEIQKEEAKQEKKDDKEKTEVKPEKKEAKEKAK